MKLSCGCRPPVPLLQNLVEQARSAWFFSVFGRRLDVGRRTVRRCRSAQCRRRKQAFRIARRPCKPALPEIQARSFSPRTIRSSASVSPGITPLNPNVDGLPRAIERNRTSSHRLRSDGVIHGHQIAGGRMIGRHCPAAAPGREADSVSARRRAGLTASAGGGIIRRHGLRRGRHGGQHQHQRRKRADRRSFPAC